MFWIALGVFIITNAVYVVFGSGDEQWWNAIEIEKSDDKCEKAPSETVVSYRASSEKYY